MIKLALIGYGKMGKLLENLAPENGAKIVAVIDPLLHNSISEETLKTAEVCIDFTNPYAVVENVRQVAKLKKNIVIGTTGWQEFLPEVDKLVKQNNIGLLYGANFSIGMNLFFKITEQISALLNHLPEYDVWGLEKHHNKKLDSPSGTARILTEILLKNLDSKKVAQFQKIDRKIKPEELHFASLRAGHNPGEHIIGFDSEADTIEIKHTARNRMGLALGALKAAGWISSRKGIFNFRDVFQQIISQDI